MLDKRILGQRGISCPMSLINYSCQPLLALLKVHSYGSTDSVQRIMGLFSWKNKQNYTRSKAIKAKGRSANRISMRKPFSLLPEAPLSAKINNLGQRRCGLAEWLRKASWIITLEQGTAQDELFLICSLSLESTKNIKTEWNNRPTVCVNSVKTNVGFTNVYIF